MLVRPSPLRAPVVIACVGAALALVVPACAASSDLEGRPCPCVEGYRCCEPAGVCIAESATCTGGAITSAETVTRICAEPHGPALPAPRTAAALGRYLARRWLGCRVDPSAPSTALVAHAGIEFSLDETWSYLRATASGYERSTDPADEGTYQIWNDRLNQLVTPTDTTPGHDLHMRWVHGDIVLNLFFDFERGPLRFRTVNGTELWFTGEGGDGSDLAGDEGTACESDHSLCKLGRTCTSVVSAELCASPAANLGRGEGCDKVGVRTCARPLVCLDAKKQCGTMP